MSTLSSRAPVSEATHPPPPPELSAEDQEKLLQVARCALEVATGLRSATTLRDALTVARGQPVGRLQGGAFVTLLVHGELRGCIGSLEPSRPLPEAVAQAATSAARYDPRFWPLQAGELDDVDVEISVLGPFVELRDADALRPGVDGVMVECRGRRGLLLPEVAVRQGWDGRQLLSAACEKEGMPPDAWRDPATRLLAFRTVRFGGPAHEPRPRTPQRGAS